MEITQVCLEAHWVCQGAEEQEWRWSWAPPPEPGAVALLGLSRSPQSSFVLQARSAPLLASRLASASPAT